tara:strand:+ start:107 stop:925 length:819 start_codon:yes stop_codon:yes gene_type:complete
MIEIKNEDIENILFSITKKIILPKFKNLKKSEIMRKKNNDLVTVVDINVEKQLKADLLKLLPGSLFVGEELFEENNKIIENYSKNEYCWTVDPIDGTNNFSKGLDNFAIMISLTLKEKILQSWIYIPIEEKMTYAIHKGGSFYNKKKLKSSNRNEINLSVGSISTKYWDSDYDISMKNIKKYFKNISSYGCIGKEYVDIARGIRDFAILSKLSPWDHIPGILILREAGGCDNYFNNEKYNFILNKKNLIIAGNNNLGKNILNLINGDNNEYK